MASTYNNQAGSEAYTLIDDELYQLLVIGDVTDLARVITSNQVDVLKLRSAKEKDTILHIAARFGHVDLVNNFLSQWPRMMVQRNSQGDLPIHSALNTGKLNVVDALVSWLQQLQATTNDDVAVNQVLGQNNLEGNTALHIALEICEENIVRDLVDLYPPASYVINNEGTCPLYVAIKKELAGLVQHMLLKLQPFQKDALGCLMKGQSVLHAAVNAKRTEMLDSLLRYDDRKLINLLDKEGWTALSHAASQGYIDKVHIFHTRVEDSAFISNKDKSFPIHKAVLGGHLSIISLLSSSRFLLNGKDQNILHLATSTGNSEMVSHMLSLPNVDSLINQNDEDGNTPLHLATLAKHVNVVEILIQSEVVNVGLSNKEGMTANDLAKKLTFADDVEKFAIQRLNLMLERVTSDIKCFHIDGKLYRLLVNREVNEASEIVSARRLQLKDLLSPEDGSNVLHIAACMDHPMLIVDLLLGYNCANLMYQANKKGDLPIHSAVKAGKLRSLEALFQWSDIPADRICERRNMDGNTALHLAVLNNQREISDFLLKQCPQTAYCLNKDNICPLFLAIKSWSTTGEKLIKDMIQRLEGNVQLQNQLKSAKSVVHIAIRVRSKAILESIIENAPGLLDCMDSGGRSTLSYAALTGYVKGVKLILEKCPDLEFKHDEDEDGSFPIHQAAKGGNNVEVIELLHPQRRSFNKKGQHVLHVAADRGMWKSVLFFLRLQEMKELVHAGDDNGDTPLHLAVKSFHVRTVFLLLTLGQIKGNSTNKEGMTVQDIFEKHLDNQDEKDLSSLQIYVMDVMLKRICGKEEFSIEKKRSARVNNVSSSKLSANKERANTLLVVATLIITVTFAAAFSPPGGYKDVTGEPILSSNTEFRNFVFCNTLALILAIGSALVLILGMNLKGLSELSLYLGGVSIFFGLLFVMEAYNVVILLYTSKKELQTVKMGDRNEALLYNGELIALALFMACCPIFLWAISKFKAASMLYVLCALIFCPNDVTFPDITI